MSYGGLGGLGTPPPLLYHPHPQLGGLGSDGGFSLGMGGGSGVPSGNDDDMSPDADNMDDLASDPLSPHNDITRSFVRMTCHPLGQTALRRTASQALLAFAKILLKIATDDSLARWRKFKRLKPHLTSIGGLLCRSDVEAGTATTTTAIQQPPQASSSSSASCLYHFPSGVRRGPGMGLHVGWAIEGAIGSRHKIDATYLSPNVNMAARLAAATKQYAVGLLFSRSFYKLLPRILQDRCRHVDNVLLKGCAKPISIYTFDIWLPKSDDATSATTTAAGMTTIAAGQAMRAPAGAAMVTGTASATSHLAPPLPATTSALASPSGLPVSSPTPLLPSSPSVLIDISGVEEATGSSRGNSNLIPHGAAGSSLAPTPADTPAAAAATASAKGSAVSPGFMSMALPVSTTPAQGMSSPSSAENSGNPTPALSASASASHTRNPSVHVTWNVALTDSSGQPLSLATTTTVAAAERKGAASVNASGSTTPALQQPPPLKRPQSLGLPSGISSGGSRAMTASASHHQLLPPLGGSAVPSRQPSASPQPLSASLSVSPSPRLSSVSLEQHVRQSLDADMQRLNATRRSSLTGAHPHPLSSRAVSGAGGAGGSGSGGGGAAASEGGHHSRRRSVSALQASHALQQQQQAELAHALHQQQLYQQQLLQQHLLQIQQQQQFQLWQQQQALADFGDASSTTASVSGVGGTVAASSTAFLMSPSPPPPASIAELGAQPLAHSLLPTSLHAHHLPSAPPSAGQTPLLPSAQQLQPPDLASSRSTSSAWPTALSLDALSAHPPPPPPPSSMQQLQEVRINMPPFGPTPPQQQPPPASVTTDPLLQKLLFVLMSLQNHTAHPLLVLTHNHASACYAQGEWLSARLLYEQVLAWQPNDGPAKVLLEYMQRTNFRPPPDWEGYRKLEKK
jgi:hypothetical protein